MSDSVSSKQMPMLAIEPKESIVFKGPYNRPVVANFYLHNPTDREIAFKVLTTASSRFQVGPVNGIIEQNGSLTVEVLLHPLIGPDGNEVDSIPFDRKRQKFVIKSAVVTASNYSKDAAEVLNKTSNDRIMENWFRCVFDGNDGIEKSDDSVGEGVEPERSSSMSDQARADSIAFGNVMGMGPSSSVPANQAAFLPNLDSTTRGSSQTAGQLPTEPGAHQTRCQ